MPDDQPRKPWTRRAALVGGGVAVAGGAAVLAARAPDRGGSHDAYFTALSKALREAGIARPVLVIDQARLAHNIAAAKAALAPRKLPLRVVVKSLPSPALIEAVATGMASDRFMVFNGAMLADMARLRPDGDLLLGKPLPAQEAAPFFESAPKVQWLIDTPERLAQYGEIARARGVRLRVNFEIDVGLHRGGFPDAASLAAAVKAATADPTFEVAGLMGYDPHVPKMPNPDGAYAASQERYRSAIAVLREAGLDPAALTLNGAGSPTYVRHAGGTVANEVSVGSAFVKPTDFDLDDLSRHVPAAFIATPVIKAQERMRLPGFEWLSGPLGFMNPNARRAFFIYGGHWLARPVSPPGLEYSSLFGRSSNQEMLTGSERVTLRPDDHVFLRPTQSEAVFLQFGGIAVFDGSDITGVWPTFDISA